MDNNGVGYEVLCSKLRVHAEKAGCISSLCKKDDEKSLKNYPLGFQCNVRL